MILGLFLCPAQNICAKDAEPSSSVETATTAEHFGVQNKQYERRSFFLQFYDDGMFLASRPDFYLLMGGIGAAPYVFPSFFDGESVSLNTRWGESVRAQDFFGYGHWMGQATLQVGLAAVNIGIGKIVHSSKMQAFGEDIIHVQGYNALVTLSMKFVVNRKRPNGGSYGYPSGHTSTSFASAGVVYSHFGKVWGAVAFVGASYIGLSRIADNKHYLSDVIAGAVIGSYIGLRIGHRSNQKNALSVVPTVGHRQGGLAVAWRF